MFVWCHRFIKNVLVDEMPVIIMRSFVNDVECSFLLLFNNFLIMIVYVLYMFLNPRVHAEKSRLINNGKAKEGSFAKVGTVFQKIWQIMSFKVQFVDKRVTFISSGILKFIQNVFVLCYSNFIV